MRFPIAQVWVDEDAKDEPLTREILDRIGDARVLTGHEVTEESRKLQISPDPFRRGKRILRLTRHKGAFVKPCPGTGEYVCCGLEILHIGQGCPMDCRYCALQVYFNRPVLEVFVNIENLFDELHGVLDGNRSQFHRICTGEFTDSLALDPLTGLSGRLVNFFSIQPNACLELKTKTDLIDPLLDLDPRGRVVLSFSVNSAEIALHEEIRAVPIQRRLNAAARAAGGGYGIGFHFDPIIPMPGWDREYPKTVDDIFRVVDPFSVAWISLGVLRFAPDLKEMVKSRFGPVPYFHDGFMRGLDGKRRLQADLRIKVYRLMAEKIRRYSQDVRIYLCMESPYVWRESLGITMDSSEDLDNYLDEAVR